MGDWTIFSNHGHVLVCLAKNNQARLRDVAAQVGITERAVQNILRELQGSGLVEVSKQGRCNHYQINTRKSLRHPLEAHCTVGKLLQMLKPEVGEAEATTKPSTISQAAVPKPRVATELAMPVVTRTPKPPVAKIPDPAATPIRPHPATPAAVSAEKPIPQSSGQEKNAMTEAKSKTVKSKKPETPGTQQGSLF